MWGGDRGSSRARLLVVVGVVLAGAAAAMWWIPWTAFDSRCSLATRHDEAVRGACADGAAALMPWFAFLAVTASVLLLTGIAGAWRRGTSQRD